jgi:hypothetical protein
VLGGEPMFQPEFEECLNFFETHENPGLHWKMFSNLKHNNAQFRVKIDKIASLVKRKKIRSMQIVASIDCWGDEQEYSRNGMSLNNWEDNFNYLLTIPEINIFIQSTISPITLPTAYVLVDKVIEWNKIKQIHQGWNVVANPPFLDPSIFGHYMSEYVDKLLDSAQKLKIPHFPDISYLDGFGVQIKSAPVNIEMLTELRNYLDALDVRREQNWRSIYPWMNEIFIKELGPKA